MFRTADVWHVATDMTHAHCNGIARPVSCRRRASTTTESCGPARRTGSSTRVSGRLHNLCFHKEDSWLFVARMRFISPDTPQNPIRRWMGDPIRAILAREIVHEIERLDLLANVRSTGQHLLRSLEDLSGRAPGWVDSVRGEVWCISSRARAAWMPNIGEPLARRQEGSSLQIDCR
jgi:hypothetical protein